VEAVEESACTRPQAKTYTDYTIKSSTFSLLRDAFQATTTLAPRSFPLFPRAYYGYWYLEFYLLLYVRVVSRVLPLDMLFAIGAIAIELFKYGFNTLVN
jgi:hypothetical protein